MRRWLLVVVLVSALGSPGDASQGAAPPLAPAIAAQRAGDYATAARLFGEAASVPSPIPEYALYLQADALSRQGNGAAAGIAAQAVEQAGDGPLLPAALLLAAREATRLGDYPSATAFYRRFLDRYPEHWDSPAARFGLAEVLEATGQREEALRLFRAIGSPRPCPSRPPRRATASAPSSTAR
jgi:tetratricopeptide (TPR) repeat protein